MDGGYLFNNPLAMAFNDAFGGGSVRQQKVAEDQMRQQKEENALDRQFQTKVMDLQNKYYKDQQEYNYGIWKKQFDLTNSWNTPIAQIERLREAGVNPSVLFSGATSGLSGNSSQSASLGSPSVPSGGPARGVHPAGLPSGTGSPGIGILNAVSQGLKNIADARKVGLDTKLLEDTYDSEVRRITSESKSAESKANIDAMTEEIKRANLPHEKKSILFDQLKKVAEATRDFAAADASQSETQYKNALKRVQDLLATAQEYKNTRLEEYCDAEIGVLKSEQQRNRAAAHEHETGAQFNVQRMLHEKALTTLDDAAAQIKQLELSREQDPDVVKRKLDNLLFKLENDYLVEDKTNAELRRDIFNAKSWDDLVPLFKKTLGVISNTTDAIKAFK